MICFVLFSAQDQKQFAVIYFLNRKSTLFVKNCVADNFKSFGKIPLYETLNLSGKETDELYAIIKETFISFKVRKSF